MNLQTALSRFRNIRRLGRCLNALVLGVGISLVLLLACGLLDAWMGFEVAPRSALVLCALALLGIVVFVLLLRAWCLGWSRSAEEADRLLGSARRPASTALGIGESGDSELGLYLAELTRERAAERIAALKAGSILQPRSLLPAARLLGIAVLLLSALWLSAPEASRTVLERLTHPAEDLPPWSRIRFVVEPSSPRVVYGGDLSLAVEVEHPGELTDPVELWVREAGGSSVQKLNCYRESPTRFSRTLDSMVEEVEVAFACGRARSPWTPVDLLLQPRVLAGTATITPPSHTGLKPLTIALDNDRLKVPEGASVSLTLESNRPLAMTSLQCRLASRPGEPEQVLTVDGRIPSPQQITFEWTATQSSELEVLIRDIRGTPASDPLKLKLDLIADRAPNVELHSPGPYLYATPSSTIPIKGFTDDEYGLSDVRLVRTLRGFRDRSLHIAKQLEDREFEFRKLLKLPEVGVSPGEIIEIYVEASDHNPSLLGRNSSAISRVLIISEDQYARYIRAKTSIEQFNARYRLITAALDEAIRALETLRDTIQQDDAGAAAAALTQAIEAHDKAHDLLNKLAEDFPAFATEKRLQELAREAAEDLQPNLRDLRQFDLKDDKQDKLGEVARMIRRLGERRQQQQKMERDAELMAQAATLLEMAARFRSIYQTQESLTKRIHTIAREIREGVDHNSRLLSSLADTQDRNREALDEFATELAKRLAKIDRPELDNARQGAQGFLEALRLTDPQSVMTLAAQAGRNGDSHDAYVQAEMARAMLEKLMERPDEFAAACKGDAGGFEFDIPDVAEAMQQLLEGLMQQNQGEQGQQGPGQGGFGFGPGQGGGQGGFGFGLGGNGQPGFSMMDVPVVGPDRMELSPMASGGAGDGQGKQGSGKRPVDLVRESANWQAGETAEASRHAPDPRSVPEAYREAVKLYYSGGAR